MVGLATALLLAFVSVNGIHVHLVFGMKPIVTVKPAPKMAHVSAPAYRVEPGGHR